ncbi:helix-turn-helix domain-containing protein [Streptomyces macrosporus]|uniref:Helix-turn-helix transcriptional regulator n=1 Tax=Streptomyces macrosporus TaxID=44032 RepID=A0ABN3JRQ6_9ACTN
MAVRETEEFAEYLRGLKERSGHSYGTLARRLHTSTSTLHRYCNGAAVPARYAPVERLARLCGASPEELLELHRRWLRADAMRGRMESERQTPPAGAAPDRGPEPAPVPEPDAPESAPEPASGAGASDPAPETRSEPASPPDPGASTTEPAPPASAPSRWRRRRLWPVAAVLVVALVLAVTAVLQAAPGRSDRGRPSAAGGAAPPGAAASPSATASPSASSSASPSTSASPSASDGKGGRGGGPGPSASRGPGGGQRESPHGDAPGAAPLSWTARSHVWRHGCDHRYLIDLPPSRVPPPPIEQDAAGWARSLGAVHGGETIVEATVHGTGRTPVVVEAVHVRVAARRTPLARSSFEMNNGCGGSLSPAAFSVDLDAPRPLVKPMDGYDGDAGKALPAVRLPYRVTADDPLALRIEARTEGCDCDWYVEVEWSSGNDSGTLRVDDGGRPFRTSAAKGRPAYGWSVENGVWAGG